MHSPTGLIFGALSMLLAAPPGSYIRYKLFELAASADTIVSGAISDVNENTFEFEIHGVVAGQVSKSLRVRRFRNWTCAARWAPYSSGQELLLFLASPEARKENSDEYHILGSGDEGEMPRVAGRSGR